MSAFIKHYENVVGRCPDLTEPPFCFLELDKLEDFYVFERRNWVGELKNLTRLNFNVFRALPNDVLRLFASYLQPTDVSLGYDIVKAIFYLCWGETFEPQQYLPPDFGSLFDFTEQYTVPTANGRERLWPVGFERKEPFNPRAVTHLRNIGEDHSVCSWVDYMISICPRARDFDRNDHCALACPSLAAIANLNLCNVGAAFEAYPQFSNLWAALAIDQNGGFDYVANTLCRYFNHGLSCGLSILGFLVACSSDPSFSKIQVIITQYADGFCEDAMPARVFLPTFPVVYQYYRDRTRRFVDLTHTLLSHNERRAIFNSAHTPAMTEFLSNNTSDPKGIILRRS